MNMSVSDNAVDNIPETLPEETYDTSVSDVDTNIPVDDTSEPREEEADVSVGEIVDELLGSEPDYSGTTVTVDNTEVVALLEQIYASELKQEEQNEVSISILLWFLIIVVFYFIYRGLKIFF